MDLTICTILLEECGNIWNVELEELLKYSELSGQFCESLEDKNVEDSADSRS